MSHKIPYKHKCSEVWWNNQCTKQLHFFLRIYESCDLGVKPALSCKSIRFCCSDTLFARAKMEFAASDAEDVVVCKQSLSGCIERCL